MGQGGNGCSQGRRSGMKKRLCHIYEEDKEALTLLLMSPFSYNYQTG